MSGLIGVTVGIAMAIVMVIVVFSIFPQIIGTIVGEGMCPAIVGDTDGDFVQDTDEKWTGDPEASAWSQSCNNIQAQIAIVPVFVVIAVIIAIFMFVTRMFGGMDLSSDDDHEEAQTLPKGYKAASKPSTTITKAPKKKSLSQKMRWFIT